LCLVRAGADVERLDREARVANPGEPVVPVATATHRLREGGRRCGDDRAGGPVCQALEHTRAEADELPVRTLVDVVLGLPRAPCLGDVADSLWHRPGWRRTSARRRPRAESAA